MNALMTPLCAPSIAQGATHHKPLADLPMNYSSMAGMMAGMPPMKKDAGMMAVMDASRMAAMAAAAAAASAPQVRRSTGCAPL
jgi:hypothetical protein